eukprot:scaffold24350_cov129-Isochrysis_galbana.AAC.1
MHLPPLHPAASSCILNSTAQTEDLVEGLAFQLQAAIRHGEEKAAHEEEARKARELAVHLFSVYSLRVQPSIRQPPHVRHTPVTGCPFSSPNTPSPCTPLSGLGLDGRYTRHLRAPIRGQTALQRPASQAYGQLTETRK